MQIGIGPLMQISINQYILDVSTPKPIYLHCSTKTPWRCFGIEETNIQQLFKINNGSGCRCDQITFCPHSSGTHLETSAHVDKDGVKPFEVFNSLPPLIICKIINVDEVENCQVMSGIEAVGLRFGFIGQMVDQVHFNLTGLDPPYIRKNVMQKIQSLFPEMKVLLVDLPSVDKEDDDGQLLAHKLFFDQGGKAIIEMCHFQTNLDTTLLYSLSINMAPFDSDACPCAPILYPIKN